MAGFYFERSAAILIASNQGTYRTQVDATQEVTKSQFVLYTNRCTKECLNRYPNSCHNKHFKSPDRCSTNALTDALTNVLTYTLTDA